MPGMWARQRIPSEPVVNGNVAVALVHVNGRLGRQVTVDPRGSQSIYAYYEAFTPPQGALNFVFQNQYELPLQTIWGRGMLRPANTFSVRQPMQVRSPLNLAINGIGGLQVGQFNMYPLIEQDQS